MPWVAVEEPVVVAADPTYGFDTGEARWTCLNATSASARKPVDKGARQDLALGNGPGVGP